MAKPKPIKYKTVKIGDQTLQVATKLSAADNAKHGYCRKCSGNGTLPNGRNKVKTCDGGCNGTGRAT